MLRCVATLDLLGARGLRLDPAVDCLEQHLQALGAFWVVARGMQPREVGVADHLHQLLASASSRPASAPSPQASQMVDASPHLGVCSAREGRGAEASSVAIRR